MNRSESLCYSGHRMACPTVASVTGAAAAPPVTTPTTVVPAADNYAHNTTVHTRAGVGQYTIFLKEKFPRILSIAPSVIGTDGKKATVVSFDVTAASVTILTWTVAGVAVDLAATDRLTLTIWNRLDLS